MQIATRLRKDVQVGPQTAFICTYVVKGLSYGVTLYGKDEEDVLTKHAGEYPNLRVDGKVQQTFFL